MTNPSPTSPHRPDWWLVFRKFLKHGTSIATFVPSSKYLARSIIKGIDFQNVKCIVELGAGTGPITVELLKRVQPQTKLLIVEVDPDFCQRLRARFPGADIVEGDAAHLDDLLKARGINEVDHVISGLPLPSFSPDLRKSIIDSSMKVLSQTGTFRQLTNMPFVYWQLYRKYFTDVRFKLVPLNFPPAGVYVCTGSGKLTGMNDKAQSQQQARVDPSSTGAAAPRPNFKALAILEKIAAMHERMTVTRGDSQRIIDSLRRGEGYEPSAQ